MNPRARGVDEAACGDATAIGERRAPAAVDPLGLVEREIGFDRRAIGGGVDRIGEGEAGVIDEGVPIDEALRAALERIGEGAVARPEPARSGQRRFAAQQIVKIEPGADHPPRAHGMFMRQDEFEAVDQVRRRLQQPLALVKRLRDQAEIVIFEIAQAAVNQLGRFRRRLTGEIALVDEQHRQAKQRRLARDRAAVDAAADDEEIVVHHAPPTSFFSRRHSSESGNLLVTGRPQLSLG